MGHCLGIDGHLGELIVRGSHQSPRKCPKPRSSCLLEPPFFFTAEDLKILHFTWFPALLWFLQVAVWGMALNGTGLNLVFLNHPSPRQPPTANILLVRNVLSRLSNISEFFYSWKFSEVLHKNVWFVLDQNTWTKTL